MGPLPRSGVAEQTTSSASLDSAHLPSRRVSELVFPPPHPKGCWQLFHCCGLPGRASHGPVVSACTFLFTSAAHSTSLPLHLGCGAASPVLHLSGLLPYSRLLLPFIHSLCWSPKGAPGKGSSDQAPSLLTPLAAPSPRFISCLGLAPFRGCLPELPPTHSGHMPFVSLHTRLLGYFCSLPGSLPAGNRVFESQLFLPCLPSQLLTFSKPRPG